MIDQVKRIEASRSNNEAFYDEIAIKMSLLKKHESGKMKRQYLRGLEAPFCDITAQLRSGDLV